MLPARHLLLAFTLVAGSAPALAGDAKAADAKASKAAPAAAAAAPAATTPDSENAKIAADKARADKKALMALNLALTDAEGKGFWPLYEEYQDSITALNTREVKVLVDFSEAQKKGGAIDDSAKKLIDDMLAADQAETDLRKNMAPKLLKVIPPLKAARYLQLEDKIRAGVRGQLAARLPLVGGPLAGAGKPPAKPAAAPAAAKKP